MTASMSTLKHLRRCRDLFSHGQHPELQNPVLRLHFAAENLGAGDRVNHEDEKRCSSCLSSLGPRDHILRMTTTNKKKSTKSNEKAQRLWEIRCSTCSSVFAKAWLRRRRVAKKRARRGAVVNSPIDGSTSTSTQPTKTEAAGTPAKAKAKAQAKAKTKTKTKAKAKTKTKANAKATSSTGKRAITVDTEMGKKKKKRRKKDLTAGLAISNRPVTRAKLMSVEGNVRLLQMLGNAHNIEGGEKSKLKQFLVPD